LAVAAAAASKNPLAARSAVVLRGKLLRRYIFRALTRLSLPSSSRSGPAERDGVCLVNFAFFSLFTHIIYGKMGREKEKRFYVHSSELDNAHGAERRCSLLQLVRHAQFFHPRLMIKNEQRSP
jgi:hypothetical protein